MHVGMAFPVSEILLLFCFPSKIARFSFHTMELSTGPKNRMSSRIYASRGL